MCLEPKFNMANNDEQNLQSVCEMWIQQNDFDMGDFMDHFHSIEKYFLESKL